jgi:hypothetical protein
VWPFERRHDVLRIGRECVELWAWTARGLVLRDHEQLAARAFDAAVVSAAVAMLLVRTRPGFSSTMDVVLESAWLPTMPIEPGPALLSRVQVEALLRHRITQVYGPVDELGGAWELMVDHRAGDRSGLGFALSSSLRTALLDAAVTSKRKVASMQPAFAWGRSRLRGSAAREGWLLWAEQDRSLLALMRGGRVHALNAAAPTVTTSEQAVRLARIEALRQGITANDAPMVVAGWQESTASTARGLASGVSWISVAAPPSMERASGAGRVAGLERAA